MTEIGQYFDSKHNMASVVIEIKYGKASQNPGGVETGQRITYSGISGSWVES